MSDAPKGRVNLEKAAVLLLSPPAGMELVKTWIRRLRD